MTTFTIHAPPGATGATVRPDALVVVPEAMSWGALLVPFVWAPWHRMWTVFAGWIVATAAIEATDAFVDPRLGAILSFGFLVWFGLAGHDLRRWTLERRGFRLAGIVEAKDAIEAEARFFGKLADPARPRIGELAEPAPATAAATPSFGPIARPDLPTVVGFPDATGGRR